MHKCYYLNDISDNHILFLFCQNAPSLSLVSPYELLLLLWNNSYHLSDLHVCLNALFCFGSLFGVLGEGGNVLESNPINVYSEVSLIVFDEAYFQVSLYRIPMSPSSFTCFH